MTSQERARLYGRVVYYYLLSKHRADTPHKERVSIGPKALAKLLERPEQWVLRHMATVSAAMPREPISVRWSNGRLTSQLATQEASSDDVATVFRFYGETTGRRIKLNSKRQRLIRARLKSYTVAELCEAITGNSRSPFHQGQNDNGTIFNNIELILRNDDNVDRFRQYAARPSADSGDVVDRLTVIMGGRS